jgi:hypothetical protein
MKMITMRLTGHWLNTASQIDETRRNMAFRVLSSPPRLEEEEPPRVSTQYARDWRASLRRKVSQKLIRHVHTVHM